MKNQTHQIWTNVLSLLMEYHYFLLMFLLWFLISNTQQVVSVLVTWFLLQLDCPLDLRGFPVYVWTHFPEFHIYHVMTLVLTKQIVYFSCHKTWINQYEEITQYHYYGTYPLCDLLFPSLLRVLWLLHCHNNTFYFYLKENVFMWFSTPIFNWLWHRIRFMPYYILSKIPTIIA